MRFYAELNDHLAPPLRQRSFELQLRGRASVKDVIESCGVPHTEIELLLINGRSVGLDAVLHDGDSVSVYPMFEALDVSPLLRLRPRPMRVTRFVLDVHLGRLARYLRLLGFDTWYEKQCADEELVRRSRAERRILLTRDRGLLKRSAVTHGAYLYATDPRQQLSEVLERFDLRRALHPFRRCIACNGRLMHVSREVLEGRLDPGLLARHQSFRRCPGCNRIYWPGTHHARMQRLVEEVTSGLAPQR